MYILGISAFYHDSAASIIKDGEIIAAAQEERFSRVKHDAAFPENAIRFCLDFAGISPDDLDAVAFYDKPFLKFERLLETYYAFAPKGIASFIKAIPVWLKEKLFLKKMLIDGLKDLGLSKGKKVTFLFPEHHLSHAASAFYPSPYQHAAILTLDGVGEWATASICEGRGKDITVHKELHFPHSVGLLYSAFTYFLGFKVNSGEYKLMGLAPYASRSSEEVRRFINIIRDMLVHVKEDGSIWLNMKYFSYPTGLKMIPEARWEKLFGFKKRNNARDSLEPHHFNLAMAIQCVTEEIVLLMARETQRITGADHICLAGGVSLNCVANGKLDDAGIFKDIYIQPAAGDAGGAIGAALAAYHIYFGRDRILNETGKDNMKGALLGPRISETEIALLEKKFKAKSIKINDFNELCDIISGYISSGAVVGWVQGRMEFGPRALGNRSILADARNPEMKKRLNLKIKFRESFRPFAPAVLLEDRSLYFDILTPSPYMLLVKPLQADHRIPIKGDENGMSLRDKLYLIRSDLPAITHVDFSARIQTVDEETNPEFRALLLAYKKLTGCSVLINTSFNVRGEPIVNTAEDAYRCFMRTGMDYLVINNYIFVKTEQPEWTKADNWKEEFILD